MPISGLIDLLRSPGCVLPVDEADWNEIVEQASRNQLLGQLATRLQREDVYNKIPEAVQRHLALAALTSAQRSSAAGWEISVIRRAVDPCIRLVMLKGCGYMGAGDANAVGRIFSDIDVLVDRNEIERVESDLVSAGWKPSRLDDYDSAYYRNWMHEVPAMEHVRRHTIVDLHHAINPPVSRYFIDPGRLLEELIELSPGLYVLSPRDRIIHCALHLIQEGQSKKLMRDLYDLNLLVEQHAGEKAEQTMLLNRAKELGVLPLIQSAIGAAGKCFRQRGVKVESNDWLERCLIRAANVDADKGAFSVQLAGISLLMYAHWIKMPMRLLVPHLLRKAFIRLWRGNSE